MKRVFGTVEAVFNIFYLVSALVLGFILLFSGNSARILAGVMALVLAGGDAFHLIPRIIVIFTASEHQMRRLLGIGKQITSITMTVFYLLLWQILIIVSGQRELHFWSHLLYVLAFVRIVICLLPQNKWYERYPPIRFGIARNVPFFMQGVIVSVFYFLQRNSVHGLGLMWLAVLLSFAFYLPVVLWANKNPKTGILMLPKSCAYLWMLVMCLSI